LRAERGQHTEALLIALLMEINGDFHGMLARNSWKKIESHCSNPSYFAKSLLKQMKK
jgi:hypothetical protein